MTSVAGDISDHGEALAQDLHSLAQALSELSALVEQTTQYLTQAERDTSALVADATTAAATFESELNGMASETQAALEQVQHAFEQGTQELQADAASLASAAAAAASALEGAHTAATTVEGAASQHLTDVNAQIGQLTQALGEVSNGIDTTQQQMVQVVQAGTVEVGHCHENWTRLAADALLVIDEGLRVSSEHLDRTYVQRVRETHEHFHAVTVHVANESNRRFQQFHEQVRQRMFEPTHAMVHDVGRDLAHEADVRRQVLEESSRAHRAAQSDLRSAFHDMRPAVENVAHETHAVQHVWDTVRSSPQVRR